MIPELGHYALILSLLTALMQAWFALAGARREDDGLMAAGLRAAVAGFLLTALAFLCLTYAHVTDDFSVLNVYENGHTLKPLLYKISGVWGSHEGSMLLWLLMLTGYGAAMAVRLRGMPVALKARAVGVQGLMGIGFAAFILFTSDPFSRLWPIPPEGRDLNPLLQDPGLAFHPPFLYFGYVGFSSVFSLAAAQLLSGWVVAPWAKWTRPYALTAWSSLTLGIALGSWWAYYELGWGGWWFWDPVENAALMPWLAGTALLHSLLATWQRGALARWTVLLCIITFSLSLLGTFLVRSGVLTSVHSFASDPTRGVAILALLAVMIGGALALYAAKAMSLRGSPMFEAISRESGMLINNLLLCAACATVLTGTLYPLLLDALGGGIVSVGAPYFTTVMMPLFIPLAIMMAAGPLLQWRRSEARAVLRQLRAALACSLAGLVAALYAAGFKSALGLVAVMLGCWVMAATLGYARRSGARRGVVLAHCGLAVTIFGMAGSAFSSQYMLTLKPHEVVSFDGYRLEFSGLDDVEGPNYAAERGTFNLWHDGAFIATLTPERRYFPSQAMTLSDVSIHTNLLRDIYMAMSEEQTTDDQKERSVRLQINPLVPWIWLGALIMAAGGISAIWPRRYKGEAMVVAREPDEIELPPDLA